MHRKEKEIREYIEQIRGLCDKVVDCLDNGQAYDVKDEMSELVEDFKEFENLGDFAEEMVEPGQTEVFEDIRQNAIESVELKRRESESDTNKIPYLVRKRTGEKIIVNRNIFKIGKESTYVDYCIEDNATISRSHADIIKRLDGFYLKDMGSLNHTFLNGVKLVPGMQKKLENGCLVQLSDEVFEWHCD
jgi:uncharacterized protein YlzI (FlbEa/FlbD family)